MKTESFPYQKRVRAMGTALAIVSSIGLLFWLAMALVNLFLNPTWLLGSEDKEALTFFERFVEEDAPDPKVATDEELRSHFETHFAEAQSDLPAGVTEEIYANTMVYFTKLRAGEVLAGGFMLSEAEDFYEVDLKTGEMLDPETGDLFDLETDELPDPNFGWDFAYLSGGMTADTSIRELVLKDRAFFEAFKSTYQLVGIITALFFALLSFVILRMALSWRHGDPFGPGTIRGLRWLGVLFLAQFLAGFVVLATVPESGFTELTIYSMMFDDLATNFANGASLSCGIVFLTLSWVLDYGQKIKEEQALTV